MKVLSIVKTLIVMITSITATSSISYNEMFMNNPEGAYELNANQIGTNAGLTFANVLAAIPSTSFNNPKQRRTLGEIQNTMEN